MELEGGNILEEQMRLLQEGKWTPWRPGWLWWPDWFSQNIHSLSSSSSPLWGLLLGLSCCPGLRGRPSPFDLRPPCVRPPWGKEKISMRSKVNKSYLLPDNITDSISGCCSIIIIVFINPPGAGPSCRFGCKHRCLHFQGSPTRLRATLVRRIAFHFRIIGQGRISG